MFVNKRVNQIKGHKIPKLKFAGLPSRKPGDGSNGYTVIQVLSTKTDTIKVSQFINDIANDFLSVINLSDTLAGHFSVNVA